MGAVVPNYKKNYSFRNINQLVTDTPKKFEKLT